MKRILVTGATGFVGRNLVKALAAKGFAVRGIGRSENWNDVITPIDYISIGDINESTEWRPALNDVSAVIHLAARVHVMRDSSPDSMALFRQVNVAGTEQLLNQAVACGVRRFIYISTVKVHGDSTDTAPFTSLDALNPTDPYGTSKKEAEVIVANANSNSGIETVIVRPPLVYGPGVGGNFIRLLQLVDKGVPLPFGRVVNKRSLVSVKNLCDLIVECLQNPAAPGKQFLISDNCDLSTVELVSQIAAAMDRPARLIPVPAAFLKWLGRVSGRSADVSRLVDSLQVDIREAMSVLDWQPPESPADGIAATVEWYKGTRRALGDV